MELNIFLRCWKCFFNFKWSYISYFYLCVIEIFCCFRVLSIEAVLGSSLTILHECIPKICEVN